MALFAMLQLNATAEKSPYEWALIRLDYIREEKIEDLQRFCDRMQKNAGQAAQDEAVISFFEIMRQHSAKPTTDPQTLKQFTQLHDTFLQYYVETYYTFYDMLFINTQGQVFFTVRKESDLNQNLLKGEAVDTPLGQCIAAMPTDETFVDYHLYGPSNEVAAFFVEPVRKNDAQIGWVALQCSINRVNALFTSTPEMGQTGEVFLVNKNGFMLTESHFLGESSILRQKLDDRNIQAKFNERKGHRIVTDYRQSRALSSFHVFPFMQTQWLVVAKIDQAEITTRYYQEHPQYFATALQKHLTHRKTPPLKPAPQIVQRPTLRIDMDEFLKAGKNTRLETWGIHTCSAILAACPHRFAYLAHISNIDVLYGGEKTNLLGQMTQKMLTFDLYPYEKRQMRFVLVSPNPSILPKILETLTQQGFLLSQIYIAANPKARNASMIYDYKDDQLLVTWNIDAKNKHSGTHTLEDMVNAGDYIRNLAQEKEE